MMGAAGGNPRTHTICSPHSNTGQSLRWLPRNLPLTKQLLQFAELSASQWPKLVAGSPISQKQSVRKFLRVHGARPHFIILLSRPLGFNNLEPKGDA